MKRVLLTGGSGFVGSNLARRLLHDRHDVHLLVRSGHATWRLDDVVDRLTLHESRLEDIARLRAILRQVAPHWVFHLAAYGAYSWQRDRARMVRTNLLGTANLVDAALETGATVVCAGSSSEYGFRERAPRETDTIAPNSDYAITKAAATHYCQHVGRTRSAPVFTLRLYSTYGPWEDPARLLPQLIRCGLQGELPDLAAPATARDYVYVDDVADAFVKVASRSGLEPGSVFNVGTGIQTRLCEVVELARSVLRIQAEPRWGSLANRTWDTKTWVADSRKIAREAGWTPRHSLSEGFRATVRWARRTGGWRDARAAAR